MLENDVEYDERKIRQQVDAVLKQHTKDNGDYAGYAFVVWDRRCAYTMDQTAWRLGIPGVMVPDYVRGVLAGDRYATLAINRINNG